MKIKMLVSVAGADFALSPGEETDRFSDGEAQRMVAAGSAVPVIATRVERAVKSARKVETRG